MENEELGKGKMGKGIYREMDEGGELEMVVSTF